MLCTLEHVAAALPRRSNRTPHPERGARACLIVEQRTDEYGVDPVLGPYLDVAYRFSTLRDGCIPSQSRLAILQSEISDISSQALLSSYLESLWEDFTSPIFKWIDSCNAFSH